MRVMFINPPCFEGFSRGQRSPQVSYGGSMYYPYWLAYAAGLLEDKGFRIELIDAPARRIPQEAVLGQVSDFNPGLIVLDTSTPSITRDLEFARSIKYAHPGISLGLVGAHPTVEAENILRENQQIDWICRREYDNTVLELAEAIKGGEGYREIRGLSYRKDGQVFHNPDRPYIEDLDRLPFVSRVYKKHLNIKDYYFVPALYPMVMIMTGRGCPFGCFFCLWPQVMYGQRYRFRSPESVIGEMLFIKKNLPQVKEIVFEDDTFGTDTARVRKICELILKHNINIPWFANLRADLDLNTLRLMKRAGLHSCAVGYESGSRESLDAMKKGITLEQSLKFAKEARKLGISVHGCFMVGFSGETKETMEETFQFARKLQCDSAQFYPVFLYPGTKAYQWALEMNYLNTNEFSRWLTSEGRSNCVYNLPGVSAEEMLSFCNRAYMRYHLSFNYLFRKLLKCIFDPMEGIRIVRSGFRFIRYLVKKR